MPRKKTEEVTAVETKIDETGAAVEQAVEKPKRTRRKKTETAEEAPAKKTVRKTRVKKEVADTVEKIKETVTRKPRKKEEGKAYYVVNGDVTGDVDLF